jgi:hypothetical protein
MRISERLRGTMLGEMREFKAAPTERVRIKVNGKTKQVRRTPPGCLSMDECSRWPHTVRVPSYYESHDVPFEFER